MLDGEEKRGEFRTTSQSFILTTHRLIFEGESRRLIVFPGGRATAAAMLRDIDLAFLGRVHVLPTWVGLVGVAAILGAFVAESGLAVLVGAVMVAAWYFLGATVLEFKVSGAALGPLTVLTAGGVDQELADARAFVTRVFVAKAQVER